MSRWSRIVSWLACILVSASSMGCATFDSAFGKKIPKATAADPVGEIVCLWEPSEGNDPEGVPCKGFMGTIMFLSRKTSAPLSIEGDIRIYLFDDQGTVEEQIKPLRQFNFDNGSWAIHLTDSSYGPKYTVFIPYVRRGVSNAKCTLQVRLKPKAGQPIFSELTTLQLSGPKKTSTGEDAKPITHHEVEKESVDAMVGTIGTVLRTTTIATGPNPQSMQASPIAKKEENPSQIQLAAHQVPVASTSDSPDADRIRRLEAMIEKLLEQQAASQAKPQSWTRIRQEASPAEMDEPPALLEPDVEPQKSSRRMKIRRSDDDVVRRSSPARRRRHPLDDDESDEASRSSDESE